MAGLPCSISGHMQSFDDAETFGERFWVQCAVQGAAGAEQVVFVSDGAPWIHYLQQAYFPGALVVLDCRMSPASCSSCGASNPRA